MTRAALSEWRRSQRAALAAAREALPAASHREKSAAILRHIETGFPALATRLVGFYWPIRHEVDPLPLIERLIAAGGDAALPVVVGRGMPLEFRPWRPGVAMATGSYDIPFPAAGPAVAPDVLLVPLLGFDGAGFRLGYGAGYYDRTLAAFAVLAADDRRRLRAWAAHDRPAAAARHRDGRHRHRSRDLPPRGVTLSRPLTTPTGCRRTAPSACRPSA